MAVVLKVTFRDRMGIFWKHIPPSTPKGAAVSFIWGVGDLKMTKSGVSHHELSFVRGQICCKKNHIPCGLETPWKATYWVSQKQAAFRVSKKLSLIFIVCKLHLNLYINLKKSRYSLSIKKTNKKKSCLWSLFQNVCPDYLILINLRLSNLIQSRRAQHEKRSIFWGNRNLKMYWYKCKINIITKRTR